MIQTSNKFRRCPTCGCSPLKLLSIGTVADFLGCNRETVRREIHRGNLRATRAGKTWKVYHDALHEYLEAHDSHGEETDT